MNSSGIKRGLAASAVGALAVAGLPLIATSASAAPINNQVAGIDQVHLVAPETATASAKFDGQNRTVRLEAAGGNDVSQVRFEYSLNAGGTYTTIATVSRNDNGAFSYEWDVTPIAGAQDALIRAVALNGSGTAGDTDVSQPVDINNTAETVNITDGTGIGVFQQPYDTDTDGAGTADADTDEQKVVVSGTASSDAGIPTALEYWNGTAYAGSGSSIQDTDADTAADNATTWTGVLNLNGYDYAGSPDEVIIRAANTQTDDAEAFALYNQVITTVTAEAERTNVPANGAPVPVTVTVTDQNGRPIAGARVADSDGTTVKFTDSNGEAQFTQGPGTEYYYADANSTAGYQSELGDRRSEAVTVTQYAAEPTTLTAESDNGSAFDIQEYDPLDDITVQVTDQNGNNIATNDQALQYYWVFTPFGTGAQERTPTTGATPIPTSADGEYVVPLPTDYATQSGTYELYAGLSEDPLGNDALASSKLLTVKAGDSNIVFDGTSPNAGVAGGEVQVSGTLQLSDGTGLPGRPIDLAYGEGATDTAAEDAAFNQATGGDLAARRVVTDANGDFSATLDDPAVTSGAQPTETGRVTAATADFTDEVGDTDTDNADEQATQEVVFAQENPGAGSTVVIAPITDTTVGKPGMAESGSVTVKDAQGQIVANQVVTLTVDGDSFFTNGAPEATNPKVGEEAGDLESLGQTITRVTNDQGVVTFQVAIERSEEFDDDGLAEDIVTATAGTFSDTEDVDYSSANPLNGGEVRLEFSPASEQDAGNDLPNAQPGSEVELDVFTEDQFGNLVGDELVTISDDTVDADIIAQDADNAPGVQVRSNFDDNGDFAVTADEEEQQTVTAVWEAPKTVYVADSSDADSYLDRGATAADGEVLRDSVTVNYADVTIDRDATTLTSSPEGEVRPGTAVTETVTVVDTEGNPVPGVTVRFTQNGPASVDERFATTNAQGKAFFVVTSAEEGTAFVTAVVETGGEPLVLQDQVVYTDGTTPPDGGPVPISPNLTLKNVERKQKGMDWTKVGAREAKGAKVKLFMILDNGSRVLHRTGNISDKGQKIWILPDPNRRDVRTFKAVVVETDQNQRGVTDTESIR